MKLLHLSSSLLFVSFAFASAADVQLRGFAVESLLEVGEPTEQPTAEPTETPTKADCSGVELWSSEERYRKRDTVVFEDALFQAKRFVRKCRRGKESLDTDTDTDWLQRKSLFA